ncbi:uncharacterized protein PSANT_01579 [Moesziomyces antarcticus]|uniref:Secreted protein n=1 Tax=Pseudozyma antarctica TaxID=84753 RepID=A0A5C3FHS1_PSEA2|nr:uncharacterized protein PSANT_01579 [Moesziomyces antarcticus]
MILRLVSEAVCVALWPVPACCAVFCPLEASLEALDWQLRFALDANSEPNVRLDSGTLPVPMLGTSTQPLHGSRVTILSGAVSPPGCHTRRARRARWLSFRPRGLASFSCPAVTVSVSSARAFVLLERPCLSWSALSCPRLPRGPLPSRRPL